MKTIKLLTVMGLFAFGISSCGSGDCYTCDFGGVSADICEEDYQAAADAAGIDAGTLAEFIDLYNTAGATCTKK